MVNGMRRKGFKINSLIIIAIVGILFFTLISKIIVNSQNENIFNDLEPFLEVLSIIRSEYIDQDVNINTLVPGAIKGMLQELGDPYSRYMDPISFQREQENLFMGHFHGLEL